jgi:hypothetical protein
MSWYKLNRSLKSNDVEFINDSDVPYEIEDQQLMGPTDSG